MIRSSMLATLLSLVGGLPAAAQSSADLPVTAARVERRDAASGLDRAVSGVLAGDRASVWLAYVVPTARHVSMDCCGSGRVNVGGGEDRDGLRIVDRDGGTEQSRLLIFLRAENGRILRVRLLDPHCRVDASDRTVYWMSNVAPAQSIALLASLLKPGETTNKRGDEALVAIVLHDDPAAVETLIDLARNNGNSHTRSQALFWLSQKAGQRAVGTIARALEDDPDTSVKRQAVFALSQLPRDEGVPLLINVARTNPNVEVRKQAMFWLGQSNDPRAIDFFADILR
jgi:HEAT repeats